MKLPFRNILKRNKNETEYYIALEIKQRSLAALLLQKEPANLDLKATHEEKIEKNINELTSEELIEVADKTVSKIEESTPPGTFIKKTIFTVPYDWQEEGKVKKERLAVLKRLCDELELTPEGFLVPIEAIMHTMRERDGALSNAVFIELEDGVMTAYIARAGSIVEIQREKIEENTLKTAEKILLQIKSFDVLPAKIIVLRGTHAEATKQELVSHEWSKDLPFLHPPQVTVMDAGFENEAIVQGVAEQMKVSIGSDQVGKGSAGSQASEIASKVTAEDLGFHKNIDVAQSKEESRPQSDNIVLNEPTGEDKYVNEPKESESEAVEEKNKTSMLGVIANFKSRLLPPVKNIFNKGSGIPIGFKLIPVVALLVIALIAYGYYSMYLKAELVLYAEEQSMEEEMPVLLASTGGEDGEVIRITVMDIEVEGSKSKEATGEEITGEKATGEVTLFNKTENEATFGEGEAITTDSNLTFILQEDVEIASTSAFSTSYSSKKAAVEAQDFGEEYNIDENTNFTIGGYSESNYFAKNSDAFSGGTREEITVVSENDIAELEEALLDELQKQALSEAEGKIKNGETLVKEIINSSLENRNFDNEVGDEAGSVTLSATGVFEIGYYEDTEISNFIKGASTENVPSGYVFAEKDSTIEFDDLEVGSGKSLTATARIKAVHLPSISKERLSDEVSRVTKTRAQEIIKEKETIKDSEINFTRSIPFFPEMLPWNPQNINVILKTD